MHFGNTMAEGPGGGITDDTLPAVAPGAIRYGLLGPVSALRSDGPVDLGTPTARVVLITLLMARGTVVPLDRIIDSVWGDAPPPSARHAVHATISRLRQVLGPDQIITVGDGYRLSPHEIDVDEAVALTTEARALLETDPLQAQSLALQALRLWRGEALSDVAYHDWAQPEIRRLDEIHMNALSIRLRALVELGHYEEATPELEAAVLRHPFRERLWALLIIALCRAGRTVEALAAFRRIEDDLVETYGVSPSPRLRDLRDRVLREDPNLLDEWQWEPKRPPAGQSSLFAADRSRSAFAERRDR